MSATRALMRDVFASHAIDAVMHFAGSIEVGESVTHPLAYYRNNTGGSLALIEAVVAAGIKRMVFSSTAAVYGEPEAQPIPEGGTDQADQPLWLDQADDRADAARRIGGARPRFRDPALFQRVGRRSARAGRGRASRSPAI